MIEIIIALIIWFWGLTPLWLNILLTVLLFFRFSWRVLITMSKVFEWNKSFDEKKECDKNGTIQEEGKEARIEEVSNVIE